MWVESKPSISLAHRETTAQAGRITSPPINAGGNQAYTLAASVINDLNLDLSYGLGQFRIHFYNANDNQTGSHLVWSNRYPQTLHGDFTTHAGTAYLQVVLEANRVNGRLSLHPLSLTAWSQPISSGPGQQFDLTALVAGQIVGGGQMNVRFYDTDGSLLNEHPVWNSSSYDSLQGTTQAGSFTT